MRLSQKDMEKGFNSDIVFQGKSYHVQTEDWGLDNPYFVTQVYQSGALLQSLKIAYWEVLTEGIHSNKEMIRIAMETQHQQILDLLLAGQLV